MSRWGLFNELPVKRTHIIPVNDLREHEYSEYCWCNPTEDTEYVNLFVHHSMDGREEFETGERKPS